MDAQPGPHHQANRHPLICGVVAAGVLLLGSLLPSAHAGGEGADSGSPAPAVPAGEQGAGAAALPQ